MTDSAINARALHAEATKLRSSGRPADALAILLSLDEAGASSPELCSDIAGLYRLLKDLPKAVAWFERGATLGPLPAQAYIDYAMALLDTGQREAAAELVEARLTQKPREFNLVNLSGVILRRQGRPEEALARFTLARKLDPAKVAPWVNSGNVYLDLRDGPRAEEMYFKATRMEPKNAEHVRMLGQSQQMQGQYPKAVATFRRSLLLRPGHVKTIRDLALALFQCDKGDEALALVVKRRETSPDDIDLMLSHADLLKRLGRPDESVTVYEKALQAAPDNGDAWYALGRLYMKGDREKANACYRRAVEINPNSLQFLGELCTSLNRSRYGSEADHIAESYKLACRITDGPARSLLPVADEVLGVLRRCIDFDRLPKVGDRKDIRDYWLRAGYGSSFHQELAMVKTPQDRLDLVACHAAWGQSVEKRRNPAAITHPPRTKRDKIRVGFLSSDLRHHPVNYFALPLLEMYDRSRFEVFCYSGYVGAADNVQTLVQKSVDAFRWWPRMPELDVAQGIANDQLDILFELGSSTMEQFEAMAYRPAPVQVSWLGYPHSSGLSAIDYILTDPYLQPEDPRLLIEKPFQLPQSWVSLSRLGFSDEPILAEVPETRRGYLTFGTMNNPYKYTREGIKAWADIMAQVPDSRFLFVRPEGGVEAFRTNLQNEFGRHGIAPERLMFTAIRGRHLTHYNDIDIALDTFPHVGGTTTCETIWMGVPVVTLVGPAFFERLSYSNLSNAGLGDLCTFSVEDYIAKAVALAADRQQRQQWRTGLRAQIIANPLGQPRRFTEAFYNKVVEILA